MAAFPKLYEERHQGCAIPTTGYSGHGAPLKNADITFAIKDKAGTTAMAWQPSGVYTITVPAYSSSPVNAWVHATAGAIGSKSLFYRNSYFLRQKCRAHKLASALGHYRNC